MSLDLGPSTRKPGNPTIEPLKKTETGAPEHVVYFAYGSNHRGSSSATTPGSGPARRSTIDTQVDAQSFSANMDIVRHATMSDWDQRIHMLYHYVYWDTHAGADPLLIKICQPRQWRPARRDTLSL